MRTVTIILALSLAACATPEERAEAMIARYGPFCQKLGFTQGSESFAGCIMQQANSDSANAMRLYGTIQQSRPRTCQAIGNTVQCY